MDNPANYAVLIAIHDAWIWKCHYCIFVHRYATDGKKVRYILRLAVKCNQNDSYVKDQERCCPDLTLM